MEGNRHYLLIDEAGRILAGWSDGPFPDRDTSGAVLLREDGGYQFRLFPGGEENPPLTDETGAHLWRYENGQVRAGTAGELAAERAEIEANTPPPAPTDAEKIAELESEKTLLEAQVSALSEQNDFQEELIVELANVVYA